LINIPPTNKATVRATTSEDRYDCRKIAKHRLQCLILTKQFNTGNAMSGTNGWSQKLGKKASKQNYPNILECSITMQIRNKTNDAIESM